MLNLIDYQLKTGRSLTQSKYFSHVDRGQWPSYYWHLYPIAQEYYHELNPYFLFWVYKPEIYRFAQTITVRDGYLTFINFLLKNHAALLKKEMKPMFIHPSLAPFVPPRFAEYFLCWHLVQRKQVSLATAKKVIIFGFANEEYLGNPQKISEKCRELRSVKENTPLEIHLPMRTQIFKENHDESESIYNVINEIRKILPKNDIHFLKNRDLMERSDFKDTCLLDLISDHKIITDNYLYHHIISRGGSVHEKILTTPPKNSILNIELSLYHELHLTALPECTNMFGEVYFLSKLYPGITDVCFNPYFQKSLEDLLQKNL